MALLRRYDLLPADLDGIKARVRPPENYIPEVDPVLDRILLARTNDAWRALGDKMGFKWETVRPAPGYGEDVFLAEPKDKE